jgi:hypothetical protein
MKNNINDLAIINLSIENLVKQNKEIKEEASKFFPELESSYNELDHIGSIEMRLDNKLYEHRIVKDYLEYYDTTELCNIVASDLARVYQEKLEVLLKEHIEKILLNKKMFDKHGSL